MKPTLLILVTALALGALAGCNRNQQSATPATPPSSSSGAGATAPQSNTPSTPANLGTPQSQAEKQEGANPTQGQVDPKEGEQHRDFQQRGDAAGPKQ